MSDWNTGYDKNGRSKRIKNLEVKLEILEVAAVQGASSSSSRASYSRMSPQPLFQTLMAKTSLLGEGMSFRFSLPGGLQQQLREVGTYKVVVSLTHETLNVTPREVLLEICGKHLIWRQHADLFVGSSRNQGADLQCEAASQSLTLLASTVNGCAVYHAAC